MDVFTVRRLFSETLADYAALHGVYSRQEDAIAWAQGSARSDVMSCFTVERITIDAIDEAPRLVFSIGPLARPIGELSAPRHGR